MDALIGKLNDKFDKEDPTWKQIKGQIDF